MSTAFKKSIEQVAGQLGYSEVRHLGSGHLEAIHPNGARVRLPFTPRNEWRESRNARAALERAAGRKIPRANAAKFRATAPRQEGLTDPAPTFTPVKDQGREKVAAQLAELDEKIRRAKATGDRLNAKGLMAVRRSVAKEAEAAGLDAPPFRN